MREKSSPEHPLSIKQICAELAGMSYPPSEATIRRLLKDQASLMELLYQGQLVAQDGEPSAYFDGKRLHVVLENVDKILQKKSSEQNMRAPSYSTVDNLLKQIVDSDLHTFPYTLRCVEQKKDPDTGEIY